MDTMPVIVDCFLHTLQSWDVHSLFQAYSDPSILPAAATQDCIGWLFFLDGCISSCWHSLQAAYYCSCHSCHMATQWVAGLVTCLLSISHSQWTHCNSILHANDAQGLHLQEHAALQAAIDQQFQTGIDGLLPHDYHLIECGCASVQRLSGPRQKAWLASIQVA